MKIIHVSFAEVKNEHDPESWLKQIPFFTGIVQEMARASNVISIHHLNYTGSISVDGVQYQFFTPRIFQRMVPYDVYRFLKAAQPDAVILHGLHFYWRNFWLCLLCRFRVNIFIQHHAEKPSSMFPGLFQRLTDRFVNGYFFSAGDLSTPWIQQGLIRDKRKIHEVMEGSSHFKLRVRSQALSRTGVSGDPVFIWVGRLDDNKDPATLITAFRKFSESVKGARLYIVSKGGPLTSWVNRILDPESSIRFVGAVSHNEIEWWYSSADFVISTSHYEGSGLAVCEAMACGCIPVLSNIPSFRMMTSNGEVGLLFSAGDPNSLADALEQCTKIDVAKERNAVTRLHTELLSFEAIAARMAGVIKRARKID